MVYLTNAEPEMFTFFERTPDLVCIAGKDGFLKRANPAVIKTLGYSEADLYARPIESFIHPEDRESTRRERINLLNGKALLNFQNRYVTRQGNIVWLAWTSIYFPDKEIVFAIAKDITEKRQIEKQFEEKYAKLVIDSEIGKGTSITVSMPKT
ncbi:PAS domain S-box protein [Agriterribacter sp.]|uniref:PAS domain S-box protein n=1 Tax=Agriterribacter sp. TaxID=2821509 RepID=UPI002C2449D4|nr:PAS domain S-box protein [Agriterribacter sp.]HRP58095.1 PAS domain S-box protein [Agriterribacter sp.]